MGWYPHIENIEEVQDGIAQCPPDTQENNPGFHLGFMHVALVFGQSEQCHIHAGWQRGEGGWHRDPCPPGGWQTAPCTSSSLFSQGVGAGSPHHPHPPELSTASLAIGEASNAPHCLAHQSRCRQGLPLVWEGEGNASKLPASPPWSSAVPTSSLSLSSSGISM